MQCPKCRVKLSFDQITQRRCPNCGAKIYLCLKWRWLRGISCGLVAILLNYRWYPLEGSFVAHIIWLAVVGAVFIVLSIISLRIIPPEIDLVPQDGPIRLDL